MGVDTRQVGPGRKGSNVPRKQVVRSIREPKESIRLSFAKTPSGRQVVDLSDLIVRGAVTVGLAASRSPAPRSVNLSRSP